ncbi:hypothetical protein NE865_03093 [Phthorimaea operculella]|nr:hypothetical protein NE865_03093 [Phthorimaea operculella]
MTSISAKIIEAFRNLKSDAVPRAPRPLEETADDVNGEYQNNETGTAEEPVHNDIDPEDDKKDEKPKKKYSFGKSKKKGSSPKVNKVDGAKTISMNTQATGNVINIVESPNFRWGNNFVYNLGPTQQKGKPTDGLDSEEEHIEKTNEITLLMEAKIEPEHDHINYISQNLGKNWHSFFQRLGYTKGRIETFEIDESKYGVAEARYKLLLDWVRNEEDNSLGRLATLLWLQGERVIVNELAIMYSCSNRI